MARLVMVCSQPWIHVRPMRRNDVSVNIDTEKNGGVVDAVKHHVSAGRGIQVEITVRDVHLPFLGECRRTHQRRSRENAQHETTQ
jgi:hypothetical protein